MKSLLICSLLFSLIFILSLDISAQDVTGRIEGRIVDESGAAIPGVVINVSSPDFQGTRATQTNAEGYFRLILLPPGFYNAKITHIAYRPVTVDSIQVRLGKTSFISKTILIEQPYEMEEIVIVERRNLIDPTSTVTGGNFTKDEIEALPLQRNYQDIAVLLPQVNTSFYGDGNSFAGSTGSDNRFFIDGIDVTDPVYNSAGTNLPYNFIKEIEVKTGGYEAQYKSSLGGVLNVITYSGGDKLSGQAFGFYTSSRISNEEKLVTEAESPKGDYAFYDFGLNLKGPGIKENLWFNLAYNPNIINEDMLIPGIGYYPEKKISHLFAGKLTWRISEKGQLSFNILGDPSLHHDVESSLFPGLSSFENPEAALIYLQEGGYSALLSGNYFFSDNFLLEASVSRFFMQDIMHPETEMGSQAALYNFVDGTISGGYGNEWDQNATRINSEINSSIILDNHKIKFGLGYSENSFTDHSNVNGVYKYSDSSYINILLNNDGVVKNRVPAFFLQDLWKINNSFQLYAGIRWDGQYLINSSGEVAQKILNQFQPRIGLIFLPEQKDDSKIFTTYGRFYHDLNLLPLWLYYMEDFFLAGISYNHDPRIDPSGADTLFIIAGESQENIADLKGQYHDEFTLGYERKIFNNHRISARGILRILGSGIEDAYSSDWSKYVLGNPGNYPLSEFPKLKRDYLALELFLQKISDDHFNYSISYVLSRTFGNYPGLFNPETNQANPNITYNFDYPETVVNSTGLLPHDRTHVLKVFSSYRFDFGLLLGANFVWSSGTPLSEFGSTVYGTYPLVFLKQRGTSGRTPAIWDLNFRIVYILPSFSLLDYQARLLLDIFHVVSRETPVNYDQVKYLGVDENGNQIYPNPTYGRATSFQPPMSLRLGIEVNFN